MPLKKGHSQEVVSYNVKEMLKAGHPRAQAVAASLAHARKYKKMAMGGMIEEDDEGEEGSLESPIPEYPMGMDEEGLSPNAERAEKENEYLQKALYASNDNKTEFQADAALKGAEMDLSGLEESDKDGKEGNKPELGWINEGTEEPLSAEPATPGFLSEDAKLAIKKKRAARMYGRF